MANKNLSPHYSRLKFIIYPHNQQVIHNFDKTLV